jgi:hypothetical protein
MSRTYPGLLRVDRISGRLRTRALRTVVCSICVCRSPSIGSLAYAWPEPSVSQDGNGRDAEELTPTFPDGAETHAAFVGHVADTPSLVVPPLEVVRGIGRNPIARAAFDVLALDGQDQRGLPYTAGRARHEHLSDSRCASVG